MNEIYSYEKTTKDIRISVTPIFIDEESDPESHFYFWAYQVRIENLGKKMITILDRHWHVIDGFGTSLEIAGTGVFKDRPSLNPGDSFEYTNTIPLSTTSGFMTGKYDIEQEKGSLLEIEAPPFSLDSPYAPKTLN